MVSVYDYDVLFLECETLKDRVRELEAQREEQHGHALDRAIANQLLQKEAERLQVQIDALTETVRAHIRAWGNHGNTSSLHEWNEGMKSAVESSMKLLDEIGKVQP